MVTLQEAIEFAVEKHKGAFRKGKSGGIALPYVMHPLECVKKAHDFGCTQAYILVGLAWHDLIEDAGVTAEQLTARSDLKTTQFVLDLTNNPNIYATKEAFMNSFSGKPIASVFGKLIDRCVNVRDFLLDSPSYAAKYFHKADKVIDTWNARQYEAIDVFGRDCVTNLNAEIADLARLSILLRR